MSSKSLNEATIVGVRWLALTRVLSEVVALGAAVVLARLVSPADFGRAAVALVFVQLGVMLTFEGFASALVQRKSVDEGDRGAALLMSIVGGGVLSLAVFGLSGPLWQPLFGARTADLISLVSPVVVIAAAGGVSRATVWRSLDFRRVSLIDLLSLLVASAVSVTLAVAGLGAKAIVLGGLAQTACTSLLLILVAPPPLPRWSGRVQREIAGFGVPAALAALVDTLYRNIDYAILAARLPAAQAGYYYRAFNLGVVYQDKLSRVLGQIAFPLYSRTKSHSELRQLHERAVRVNAVVIFPLLASLIALAPLAVPFVFGPAWTPAVEPTQILAVAGMIATVLTGYPQIMLAIGRPRPLLYFNIVMVAAYGGVVVLASRHGLVVVALAVVGVHFAILAGVYQLLLRRYVGISIGRLIPELGPAAAGCLVQLAVSLPLAQLLGGALPSFLTIGLVGTAGLAVYAAVLRLAFPAACGDLRLLVARVLPMDSVRRGRVLRAATTGSPVADAGGGGELFGHVSPTVVPVEPHGLQLEREMIPSRGMPPPVQTQSEARTGSGPRLSSTLAELREELAELAELRTIAERDSALAQARASALELRLHDYEARCARAYDAIEELHALLDTWRGIRAVATSAPDHIAAPAQGPSGDLEPERLDAAPSRLCDAILRDQPEAPEAPAGDVDREAVAALPVARP